MSIAPTIFGNRKTAVLLALLYLCSACTVAPTEYRGVVVSVSDGDTLTMLTDDNQRMVVRLANIDAPEKRQSYGNEAKQSLADMVTDQPIIVEKKTQDRYKRMVGTVYRASDNINVNREQTRLGSSWAYLDYLDDPLMPSIEGIARATKAGLWRESGEPPLPPWQWRRIGCSAGQNFEADKRCLQSRRHPTK